jgi:ribosomal protein L32
MMECLRRNFSVICPCINICNSPENWRISGHVCAKTGFSYRSTKLAAG